MGIQVCGIYMLHPTGIKPIEAIPGQDSAAVREAVTRFVFAKRFGSRIERGEETLQCISLDAGTLDAGTLDAVRE